MILSAKQKVQIKLYFITIVLKAVSKLDCLVYDIKNSDWYTEMLQAFEGYSTDLSYGLYDSPMYASTEREDIGGDFGDAVWGDI